LRPLLVQIDAFTDVPFAGNPAAVCLLDAPADEAWMRRVAAEMNLSETAFLSPADPPAANAPPTWDLRWFTPEVEVELCGHATLASAHFLFIHQKVDAPTVQFLTRSGPLLATRDTNGWIELDLPADPPSAVDPPPGLLAGLGLRDEAVIAVAQSRAHTLVEVADPGLVESLAPDFAALRRLDVRGAIVTSVGTGLYDLVSRYFAPAVGIDEDPVTGSAHATLAPYWSAKLGKTELLARQVSPRGGTLRVQLVDDRALVAGQAVTVFRSRLEQAASPPKKRRSTRQPPAARSAHA
jgi:PhzF family phenazine biosynthesis protein